MTIVSSTAGCTSVAGASEGSVRRAQRTDEYRLRRAGWGMHPIVLRDAATGTRPGVRRWLPA
jgi:hypothetical protein